MKGNSYPALLFFAIGALVLDLAMTGFSASPIFLIAPNSLADAEGNSGDRGPFSSNGTGTRYQEVFAASEFSSIAAGGGLITEVRFRLDGGDSLNGGQLFHSFQIDASTTSKGPDSLSPVFADNVGADVQSVRGARQLLLVAAGSSSVPQIFEMDIPFDTPFFYNPNAGNLLLDFRNFSGADPGGTLLFADGHNVVGDSISHIQAFNVNSLTAGESSSFGLVAEFLVQPVPEPSTWGVLALGLGCVALRANRIIKRRRHGAK